MRAEKIVLEVRMSINTLSLLKMEFQICEQNNSVRFHSKLKGVISKDQSVAFSLIFKNHNLYDVHFLLYFSYSEIRGSLICPYSDEQECRRSSRRKKEAKDEIQETEETGADSWTACDEEESDGNGENTFAD